MNRRYSAPSLTPLGKLKDLTKQSFNKVGGSADVYSANTPLVGSLVPYP